MSNPTSDNKETKSRAKGPSLRIETAGDIPEERLARVAAKFAEVNEIEDYRLIIEQRDDLIGGFIVYFQGSRYDYSIKGQLSRIGSFMKQTRSFEAPVDGDVTKAAYTKEEFPSTKIKEDLEDALDRFPES
ncbi:MAG: F0F1 ATP synthase subunit delta, partial [Oscillospiraceae bacterium]|nr:F0F1 ATP synthase subunit delta [Oscillospiraceae bacterium]